MSNRIACPVCAAPERILLGTLGRTNHYRCRDCGMSYSKPGGKAPQRPARRAKRP